jgi:hypothetical protein
MTVHDMQNLREYARALYLQYSTREGIATEFLDALASDVALQNFLEKYSSPFLNYDEFAHKAARAVAKADKRERRDSRKKAGDEPGH